MRKKRKITKKKKKGLIASYNAKKTKGNLANTGLKTLVDVLLGSTLGAGIGAGAGKAALPIGLLLIAGGHFLEEESGMLRIAGAATIAYGIGKTITNKQIEQSETVEGLAGEANKAKKRLNQFKNEVFSAYYIDKIYKPKEGQEVGAIDLSSLDRIAANIEEQAYDFEELELLEEDQPHFNGFIENASSNFIEDEDEWIDFSVL